jgi:hypothetical protein
MLFNAPTFAWDRYANETESIFATGIAATNIIRYQFTISLSATYDIYTDEVSPGGDTYMYLWNEGGHQQVAKSDDASVPSGNPLCSRIKANLGAGTYIVFVRAYGQYSSGTASLFVNGTRVVANTAFGGFRAYTIPTDLRKGDRIRTKNLSPSNGDTYCLLLATNDDLVAFNDDGGDPANYLASTVTVPSSGYWAMIVGSYSPYSACTCDLALTRDNNLGFISLCGPDQHQVDGATEFTKDFSNGHALCNNPAYTTCVSAYPWEFTDQRLSSTDWGVDNVDLVYIFTHGAVGGGVLEGRDGSTIWITQPGAACGVGDRNDNTFGTCEFMAIFACTGVYIAHTQSFDWLYNYGWKSSAATKGLFDGLHVVVGYHSDYTCNFPWIGEGSNTWDARDFSNKLRGGLSVWDAFWQTNSESSSHYSNWFNSFSPGMASSISIATQKDQKLSDFRTDDITYGNPNYLFNLRWFGSGGTPPN